VSEWISVSSSLPPLGKVVLVQCVVKYGRKKQIMGAKRMDDSFEVGAGIDDWSWIALKNDNDFTVTIQLKEVFLWKPLQQTVD